MGQDLDDLNQLPSFGPNSRRREGGIKPRISLYPSELYGELISDSFSRTDRFQSVKYPSRIAWSEISPKSKYNTLRGLASIN